MASTTMTAKRKEARTNGGGSSAATPHNRLFIRTVFIGVAQEKAQAFQGKKINGQFEFTQDKTVYVNDYCFCIGSSESTDAEIRTRACSWEFQGV
jgi:hypothetical protein